MKQLIVMIATVSLGVFLFHLIMGNQGDSVFTTVQHVWEQQIELKSYQP